MNDIIQMITRLKHLITQTKDLIPKGGVRDMVLVKNSADDYDYSWSTVSSGGDTGGGISLICGRRISSGGGEIIFGRRV